MAFTRLQTNGGTAGASVTYSSACTLGSLLVAHWWGHETAGMTVSDPTNGAWSLTADEGPNIADTSSKHARWAYVLKNAGNTALVVSFANTSTTNFFQIVEYSFLGTCAYDTAVYTLSTQAAGTNTATRAVTGGTPTANGLFLMGVGDNTEGASTYTLNAGLDNLVGTAGVAAGTQTMAVAEKLLTAGANTGTLNTTPSTANNERYAIALGFYEIAPNATIVNLQALNRASRW